MPVLNYVFCILNHVAEHMYFISFVNEEGMLFPVKDFGGRHNDFVDDEKRL
jgi:hypothetical protein